MTDDTVADRLIALARAYPGLHIREATRQLDTSVALVEYHLERLVGEGTLERVQDGRFLRIYPAAGSGKVPREDRRALHAVRSPVGLEVVLQLMVHGPMAHGAIAEALEMAKPTLSFHLRKLEAARVVARGGDGYAVVDPERVARVLRAYRPTPNLRDRVARLWGDFYGEA